MALTTQNLEFANVHVTPELQAISPTTTDANYSHSLFHNVFTGPPNFLGLKVLATKNEAGAGNGLPVLLGGSGIKLSAEVCTDGFDNDNDGLTDFDDPDCQVCGNHHLDPNEQCDDGNTTAGDGCSPTCQVENVPPVARCIDVTVERDAACQAVADVNNGSSDPDGNLKDCVASPAGPYAPGTTAVTLTCTDLKGRTAACTAHVTVVDSTQPTIACPANQLVNTAGNAAVVTFPSPTATDNCGATVLCNPASGDTLALGDRHRHLHRGGRGRQRRPRASSRSMSTRHPMRCAATSRSRPTASARVTRPSTTAPRTATATPSRAPSSPPRLTALGPTVVTLTCTDSHGTSNACSATVSVVDKTPPTIHCPPNQVVECNGGNGTVSYAPPTASDNCSVASLGCTPPSGTALPPGPHDVTCSATDGAGNPAMCVFSVEVRDTAGPVVTTNPTPIEIWPPNHKYQRVRLADCVTKVVDGLPGHARHRQRRQITRVTSDEVEDDKLGGANSGDGNTCDDIVITGDTSVDVRAERMGDGSGRVYTIYFDVRDGQGNTTTRAAGESVPHDQGRGDVVVADECAYCIGSGCGTCPGHDPRCGR